MIDVKSITTKNPLRCAHKVWLMSQHWFMTLDTIPLANPMLTK